MTAKTRRVRRMPLAACALLIGLAWLTSSLAAEERDLTLGPELEVPLTVHPADGERLVLWLPSEHGLPERNTPIAERLAAAGIEVWQADLLAARFLPVQPSSLDAVPTEDIAALIEAGRATGKQVYLLASGRGAVPALLGARAWQAAHPDTGIGGAVLLFPNLYVATPEPGQAADYLPIATATNLPVYVLQPENSPWYWQLDALYQNLSRGGASVFLHALPDVRDRFQFRPDSTPAEDRQAADLHRLLARSLALLDRVGGVRQAADLADAAPAAAGGRDEARLRPYTGDPQPPALVLPGLDGETYDLQALRGEVVLLNFWASWCPPCVHEMPSMQRLRERFADAPFEILAVNMAEARPTLETFLREKVRVEFPILLDHDGAALRRWRVFAFPTSYLLDRQGRIRYALFGAIDWDTPEVATLIEALLAEPVHGGGAAAASEEAS